VPDERKRPIHGTWTRNGRHDAQNIVVDSHSGQKSVRRENVARQFNPTVSIRKAFAAQTGMKIILPARRVALVKRL
jgi:hypothetical protein